VDHVQARATLGDWLFYEKFRDLERRLDQNRHLRDRFQLVTVGATLRHLLLDGHKALAKTVAERHDIVPTYRAAPAPMRLVTHPAPPWEAERARGLDEESWNDMFDHFFQLDGVIPGVDPAALEPVTLERDSWVGFPVAFYRHKPVSVATLILFSAHVHGGVHSGASRGTIEDLYLARADVYLDHTYPQFIVGGGPIGALYGIGRVTLEGLRPLYEVVSKAATWRRPTSNT
jgi:hypothetical protein